MRNPLTFRVESSLGAAFVSLLSMFFIGLLFIAIKNFETDVDIMSMDTQNNRIRTTSKTEFNLMKEWVDDNDINIPEGSGPRYLRREYPDKPWLD